MLGRHTQGFLREDQCRCDDAIVVHLITKPHDVVEHHDALAGLLIEAHVGVESRNSAAVIHQLCSIELLVEKPRAVLVIISGGDLGQGAW